MKRILSAVTLIAVSLTLAACGGGGGGSSSSGPVTSTSSFPVKSAYTTLIANGLSKTFTISGDCGGSGTKTAAAATTAATFEGVTGFSAVGTLTMSSATPCAASSATSFTSYYDTNYIPLGFNSVGVYGVYLTAPVFPASVIVGNTGIIGTVTLYTDSTKTTGNGREDLSYVIEPDTASTAIVNVISKLYNATPALIATEQNRFSIATTGALVPISTDIQYANISTLHLVFTYH